MRLAGVVDVVVVDVVVVVGVVVVVAEVHAVLNHGRETIGEEAEVEGDGVEGFYAKYEHILLPMAVMSIALILVAFVPFLFY